MASDSHSVSVGTTATRIDSEDLSAGSSAALANVGGATVFVGGPDVTTAIGFPLAAGERMAFDLRRGDEIYGVVASGTVEVRVLEVGV